MYIQIFHTHQHKASSWHIGTDSLYFNTRQQQATSQVRGRVETQVSTPSHEVRSQAKRSLDQVGQTDQGLEITPYANQAKSGSQKAALATPAEKKLQPITEACALELKVGGSQPSKPPSSLDVLYVKPPMLQTGQIDEARQADVQAKQKEGQARLLTSQALKSPMLQAGHEHEVDAQPTDRTARSKGLEQPTVAEAEVHYRQAGYQARHAGEQARHADDQARQTDGQARLLTSQAVKSPMLQAGQTDGQARLLTKPGC